MRKIASVIVGVAFVCGALNADARRNHRQARRADPTWVPQKAWDAVKRFARQKYDPRARLFKTAETKSQSLGLKGNNQPAYIVGAKAPARRPRPGGPTFMPYRPQKTFFLVAKNKTNQWKVTPLAGMGGYMKKVDGRADRPRVNVGVGLYTPPQVCAGVQVKNARHVSVTRGTELAAKKSGQTCTVFVKGAAQDSPYALGCKANLRAMVSPRTGGNIWCGTPYPKNIPVHFSQVMFALGNRNGPQ